MSDSQEGSREDLTPLLSLTARTDLDSRQSTMVRNDLVRFTWEIDNFSVRFTNGDPVFSPVFRCEPVSKTGWVLELYPNGNKDVNLNHVSLFLCNDYNGSSMRMSTTRYTMYLMGSDGEEYMNFDGVINLSAINRCGKGKFAPRSTLFEKREQFFPNDTLTVVCDIYNSTYSAPGRSNRQSASGYFPGGGSNRDLHHGYAHQPHRR